MKLKLFSLAFWLTFSLSIFAQNDADFDNTFSIGTGFNDTSLSTQVPVSPMVIQSDGKILVGGRFLTFQGNTQNRIVRLNSDGSKDTGFNVGTGFDGEVIKITLQNDGKIIVIGNFSNYNNVQNFYMVRLNSNGTLDTTFNVGTSFDSIPFSVSIQSDGKILVGGDFANFQYVSQRRLIRLNANGTKDNTFNIGSGFDNAVNEIKVQNDGKILVAGRFTTFNGNSQKSLIRLNTDGTNDMTFNIGTGFDFGTYNLVIQTDNKIVVSGIFTTYQGIAQKNIIRLNLDGTKDTSFVITGTGFDDYINTVEIQNDGKFLVGGNFSNYNGTSQNKLIRLNSNGSADNTFNIGTGFQGSSFNYGIQKVLITSNGEILVGGKFVSYKSLSNTRDLVRLKGSPTLNNESFEETKINFYPNPVKDIITVESDNINFLEVYDLQGKQLLKQDNLSNQINVTSLQKGMYILKLQIDGKNTNQKFIKN